MKNFQYVKEFFGVITPETSIDRRAYIVENDEIFPCRLKKQEEVYIDIDDKFPTVLFLEEYGECFIFKGSKKNIVEHISLKKGVSMIWPIKRKVVIQDTFEVITQNKISVKCIKSKVVQKDQEDKEVKKYQIKIDGIYKKCNIIRKNKCSIDINDKSSIVLHKAKTKIKVIKNTKMGTAILTTFEIKGPCAICPEKRIVLKKSE